MAEIADQEYNRVVAAGAASNYTRSTCSPRAENIGTGQAVHYLTRKSDVSASERTHQLRLAEPQNFRRQKRQNIW